MLFRRGFSETRYALANSGSGSLQDASKNAKTKQTGNYVCNNGRSSRIRQKRHFRPKAPPRRRSLGVDRCAGIRSKVQILAEATTVYVLTYVFAFAINCPSLNEIKARESDSMQAYSRPLPIRLSHRRNEHAQPSRSS